LTTLYKAKLKSVKKWQLFQSSDTIGLTKINCKSSNLPDLADVEEFLDALKKPGLTNEERQTRHGERPQPLYATKPGLKEIKQVELFKKYRPLVPKEYWDECCPVPVEGVMDREKERKRTKEKIKREDKSKKKQKVGAPATVPLIVAPQQPPPLVAAASDGQSECNQQAIQLTLDSLASDKVLDSGNV
jgi:hypothetical protein